MIVYRAQILSICIVTGGINTLAGNYATESEAQVRGDTFIEEGIRIGVFTEGECICIPLATMEAVS